MSKRFAPLLFAVALIATACGSEGLPSSYSDQDARAQRQFVEACEASLAGTEIADPPAYCECAFFTVASELSFAEFLELDERLKEDPGALPNDVREQINSVTLPCQFTADDINNAQVSG